MRTINFIIVKVDKEYENDRGNLISNLDVDNASFIARKATVVSAPDYTVLKEGDEVICHHNIFRMKGSSKGNVNKSIYHIENDLYFVPLTECFMYKREGADWISLSPFCFVKPIEEVKEEQSGFLISDSEHIRNTHKGFKKLQGIMKYPCKELIELKGLKIAYSDYSEYEFIIDGELLYKMSINDILAQIE